MRTKSAKRQTERTGARGRTAARPAEAAPSAEAAGPAAQARSAPGQLAGEIDRLEADIAQRLAREVETLRAELAATRDRVAELEAHAEHDPLTGLLNRRGFERELARAAAHAQRYGGRLVLVYLDLDGLKPINDTFGHAAGDAVLRTVGTVLRGHVRTSDVVARLGGDEFAVLLWNLSDADATIKATLLETNIGSTPVPWDDGIIRVGASAGTAALDDPSATAATLARADAAMYLRKRDRRRAGGPGDGVSA
ncbi:GGDEF domain-containing protein [Rhodoplanes roseus]|uniref:diguanylate cyclase n=1 Tax=Rhodoplanes roseus TaxID=29409 RepID=A0A327KZ25_9BRAD|nr:GGDEF domain-containing protein [Rhodoplanes roseus]RAI43501.1 hypothetical protein CH341_13970 [Rhodoplanes roseus]